MEPCWSGAGSEKDPSAAENDNKLTYIDDKQTGALSVYKGDLKDQAPGNYAYSNIGNLYQDTRDSISNITWTNAQKIRKITKTDRSITFAYDPMQNRVVKYSKPNASNTEKRTYYIRDAQGNVMATYEGQVQRAPGFDITWDTLRLAEQHIYGSARVGAALPNVKLYPAPPKNPHLADTSQYPIFEGGKHYEISNHLGNVLAVITDRKRGNAVSGSSIQWFDADVVASQQYYPFGMLMPDTSDVELRRQYSNPNCFDKDYRYGFNGKEGDDEVKGDDNQQDYGMRIYDPRVGKFLSVDPLAKKYSSQSPYHAFLNNPIYYIDPDGQESKAVDKVDPSDLIEGDIANETNYHDQLIKDLKTKTGVTISIGDDGYWEANTVDESMGSETARADLLNAINSKEGIIELVSNSGKGNEVLNEQDGTPTNIINFDGNDVQYFIDNTVGMDNSTNGFAMVFLHELQHTKLGGGLQDTEKYGAKGPVVEKVNTMLKELGLPQRESYQVMDAGAGTYYYIPYSKEAKKSLKNGVIPSEDMPHIKINKLKVTNF